jgi:hypothetical protein
MKHKIIFWSAILVGSLGMLAPTMMAGTPIRLAFRDTTVASGTVIRYPLYVDSSLSGYSVSAYQLEFTYNTNLFKFDSASSVGTISSGWGTTTAFEISPGRVRIAAAGADTLAGKGKLVTLILHSFLFSGLYNQGGAFTFQSSVLNQGFPLADYRNGTVTLTPGPSITISPNTALLTKGEIVQFAGSGGTSPYTWASISPSVGTIDGLGKLTGLSSGFTKIVCTDASNYLDTSGLVEVRAFRLNFRDTSRYQGQSMIIPLYCTDLTGLNITAGQFTITFNSSLWTPDTVILSGALLSSYSTPAYSVQNGTMSISFAGTTPLTGSGILLSIRMKASSLAYGGSQIVIQSSLFNQTYPGNAVAGNLNVIQLPIVTVTPSNAQILFVGDSLQFGAIGGTPPYTWSVSDAARASISASGWLKTKKSGDITVTAKDVIGGIGSSGIISIYDFRLSIPDTTFTPSSTVQIPLYVTANAVGFSSVQMIVTYNTNTFIKLVNVASAGALTSPFTIASSNSIGSSKIAAAGVNAVNGSGVLMYLTFEVPDSTPASSYTSLTLSSVVFNEGSPRPLIQNGSLQVGSRSLIQVVPNSVQLNALVGHTDSTQITVNNLGNLSLTSVLSVIGSSAFTVSLSNINVSPGGNVIPKIYFQPSISGSDSAKLQFTTNDPFHSIVIVPLHGTTNATGVENDPLLKPTEFLLKQNYPNPFNPSTTVQYSLPVRSHVRLTIYNLVGQMITQLVDEELGIGYHQFVWNADRMSSGIYFYRLEAVSFSDPPQRINYTKRMILLK